MKPVTVGAILAALMCTASIASLAVRPSTKASAKGQAPALEQIVPKSFGEWSELPEQGVQVVNPQTKELLDKLYSQILSRAYVHTSGYRILLSMAYGDDQRGGLQAHKPEICYPAQGFKLNSMQAGQLSTPFGSIEVKRLSTSLGARNEPITYWLTVGDQVIRNGLDKRIAEIRLGLTGQVPDGLLFRISSIDNNTARAFEMQQRFTNDLLAAVPPATRKRLSGLAATGGAS